MYFKKEAYMTLIYGVPFGHVWTIVTFYLFCTRYARWYDGENAMARWYDGENTMVRW
jgi:hypothetical protein